MKIYKKDGCVVAIDGQENYLVKYDDSFYKMNEEQFKDCFGDGELTFFTEIKDSPVICFCMTCIIIATVAYYFANEKYVIIDSNFVWSNLILIINIFIHELGHILLLKLFLPGSAIKMGFKIFLFILHFMQILLIHIFCLSIKELRSI